MYYQTQDYLMHYGVLGMKWGVRKNRPQSGSRTNHHSNNKKTKYVSKNPTDIALYGHRGANKIKKKMVTKGYTHKQAEKRYVASQIGTGLALGAVVPPVAGVMAFYGPKTVAKAAVNSGKKIANKVMNKRMNMAVLDASGKVIKRYRDKGARVVFDMLTG